MCYKCNLSNKGGKLSENFSELKKGSGTSLAQVRLLMWLLSTLTQRSAALLCSRVFLCFQTSL